MGGDRGDMAIDFATLTRPFASESDLLKYGYAALIGFGLLWVGMSFGWNGAFWVAILIGAGVAINRLGGGFTRSGLDIFGP